MNESPPQRLVFGLVSTGSVRAFDSDLNTLLRWLGERAGAYLVRRHVDTYDALAQQMTYRFVDLAWLPPLVFVELERAGVAIPLVATGRGDHAGYCSVLVVRASSPVRTLEGLRGAKVAWVDPLSASGYVLPRLQLAALGINPRGLFTSEHFYGTHGAAVRAVVEGAADVAATFAGLTGEGGVDGGVWSEFNEAAESVRVLYVFGEIPADLLAIRANVPAPLREALAQGLVDACKDHEMRPLVARVFGVDAFRADGFASYESLRKTVETASAAGLLDGAGAYVATIPPPEVVED